MADEDWDAPSTHALPPEVVAKAIKHDDEDLLDDQDVADSWDEDAKPTLKAQPAKPRTKALSKNQLAKRREEEERKARTRNPEEQLQAKIETQRAVEESDHQLAAELLGSDVNADPEAAQAKGLSEYSLTTSADAEHFASDVAKHVLDSQNSANILQFTTAIVKKLCEPMKSDDIKTVESTVTVLFNQARASETSKGKKKGKANKTPALNSGVGKSDKSTVFQDYNSMYDNADDYDFL
jgi:hypothetical protein